MALEGWSILYALTSLVGYLVEGHLENMLGSRRMRERFTKLKGHIIIYGYGRVDRREVPSWAGG